MSLPGLARIVADFVEGLGLEDATIVANDTGGAVSQWLVGHHPERIGRLVLTSCDAFEKFPPTPQLYLKPAARVPGFLWVVAWTVRFKAVQRLPTAYGWTTRTPIAAEVMRSYTSPVRTIPGVRRDLARLLRAVDTRYTFEAAESLRGFDKPALVVWAADDKLFPLEHGRRLAELLPQGRFGTIAESRTFIPEEQPRRLVEAVLEFLRGV
jgi:pimeloyl-ACP methyl ester carboxylesterase